MHSNIKLITASKAQRSYHIAGRKMTMDDLPVPKGDWVEHNSRKNSSYNAVLLVGIAIFASTIGFVKV
jgi:hypothetical protein